MFDSYILKNIFQTAYSEFGFSTILATIKGDCFLVKQNFSTHSNFPITVNMRGLKVCESFNCFLNHTLVFPITALFIEKMRYYCGF